MDAIITAAMITSGANILVKLIEEYDISRSSDAKQKDVNNWLEGRNRRFRKKNYDILADSLTERSVKILHAIENGQRVYPGDLVKILYPRHHEFDKYKNIVANELGYRMRYLSVIGVVRFLPNINRYQITRLGVAFLDKAQARPPFRTILRRPAPKL